MVWIYGDYKERLEQALSNIIASLVKQIIYQRGELSNEVEDLYKTHRGRESCPTLREIRKLLHSEVREFSKVFIVIDAIDEIANGQGQTRTLAEELRALPRNVYIMVTTRPIPAIEAEFASFTRLEIRAVDEDVRSYVISRMSRENLLAKHIQAEPTLAETITSKVMGNVQGM